MSQHFTSLKKMKNLQNWNTLLLLYPTKNFNLLHARSVTFLTKNIFLHYCKKKRNRRHLERTTYYIRLRKLMFEASKHCISCSFPEKKYLQSSENCFYKCTVNEGTLVTFLLASFCRTGS